MHLIDELGIRIISSPKTRRKQFFKPAIHLSLFAFHSISQTISRNIWQKMKIFPRTHLIFVLFMFRAMNSFDVSSIYQPVCKNTQNARKYYKKYRKIRQNCLYTLFVFHICGHFCEFCDKCIAGLTVTFHFKISFHHQYTHFFWKWCDIFTLFTLTYYTDQCEFFVTMHTQSGLPSVQFWILYLFLFSLHHDWFIRVAGIKFTLYNQISELPPESDVKEHRRNHSCFFFF